MEGHNLLVSEEESGKARLFPAGPESLGRLSRAKEEKRRGLILS